LQRRANLAAAAAVTDGGRSEATVESYLALVESLKTFELAQAYYNGRFVTKKPDYVPFCAKRSTDSSYLPCVVENPHDACPDWSSASGPAGVSRESTGAGLPPGSAVAQAEVDFMAAFKKDRSKK
jgi:hypothetical protein